MKRRTVIITLLGVGVCVVAGVLIWRFAGPFGPGRKVVGDWEVLGSEFEGAMREAIEKKDPAIAKAAEGKFRSTERLGFYRDGSCRHVQNLLGMTITTQGNWKATENDDGTLTVQFHQKMLTLDNPQKGETQKKEQDKVVEWVVTVTDADHLSVAMTDEGKTKRFSLRRAKD